MSKCEACGRETEELIDLEWSSKSRWGQAGQKYKVCNGCYSEFVICVSDQWARRIAGQSLMSDSKLGQYPPLIWNGDYFHAYKDVPFSRIIRQEIDTLMNKMVQRIMFEEEEKHNASV